MKNWLLLLCMLLAATFCAAQPPDTLWTQTLGDVSAGSRVAEAVSATLDGGVWVAGYDQPSGFPASAMIYKLDVIGQVLDTFRITNDVSNILYGVTSTADGGCIATGRTVGLAGPTLLMVKLAASGDSEWVHVYDDDPTRVGYAVQPSGDGGYIAAGRSRDSGNQFRAFLVKTDASGTLTWSHVYGSSSNDQAFDLQAMANGDFVLAGITDSAAQGANAVLAIRTRSNGSLIWRQSYRPGAWDEGHCLLQTVDGGLVIGGWSRVSQSNNDMLLLKINADGIQQWSQHYGLSSVDIAWHVAQTQDNGFVLAGYTRGGTVEAPTLLKTSSSGDSMWTRTLAYQRDGEFNGVAVTPDGGIVAAGFRYVSGNASNFLVVRLAVPSGVSGVILDDHAAPVVGAMVAAIGQPYWAVSGTQGHYGLSLLPGTYNLISYGPCTGRDTVRAVSVFQDSMITQNFSVGRTGGEVEQTSLNPVVHNHIPTADTLYIRNDGAGVLDFSVQCSTSRPPTPWLSAVPAFGSVAPYSLGRVAIWVSADTSNGGEFDYFGTVDVHMNTCPDSTAHLPVIASVLDAGDRPVAAPRAFTLSANPNPFNPVTTVSFELPRAEIVSLAIYDVSGRRVCTLTEGALPAGEHRVLFDGRALASGLYIARLQTPSHNLSQKLLMIK